MATRSKTDLSWIKGFPDDPDLRLFGPLSDKYPQHVGYRRRIKNPETGKWSEEKIYIGRVVDGVYYSREDFDEKFQRGGKARRISKSESIALRAALTARRARSKGAKAESSCVITHEAARAVIQIESVEIQGESELTLTARCGEDEAPLAYSFSEKVAFLDDVDGAEVSLRPGDVLLVTVETIQRFGESGFRVERRITEVREHVASVGELSMFKM